VVFLTLSFDPTPVSVLLNDKTLLAKCITWGNTQDKPIFKVTQKYYHEFIWFVHNRSIGHEPDYKKEYK
jgi:hypothetical protein